ncbi:MAG TPA: dethiobiotin synthase [Thermodesulfovibrionales bacterium]|nr:dethiobiotin synthase [Thermodesulfovibrionales bacterium]
MKHGIFIVGTDTGVGKTVVAAAIIKALHAQGIHACGMKPIETGCCRVGNTLYPSDGMFLKRAARMDEHIGFVTPYCFEHPVAPSLASEMEGRSIHIPLIAEKFQSLLERYPAVVMEGVGGILVPIKKDYFVVDLIRELDLPLVVVAKPSLGTINHTLLTVNYALGKGIGVLGVIINFSRLPESTVAENTNPLLLKQLCPVPVIGIFPHLNNVEDETLERNALKHLNVRALREHLLNSEGTR